MIRQETRNRIAKNTLILYARQLLILFINLYTVRAVLNILGVEDFGIYNVVGGLVSFFSFLSGTMASATQRFFSFALGEKNQAKLQTIFSVNGIIYVGIALLAIVSLETIGLWFVTNQLHIPAERGNAVLWLYQLSIVSFSASIISTLFMAMIIAHEDMKIYAYVSLFEAFAKLGLILLLEHLPGDKLVLYGAMILLVSALTAAGYVAFCMRRYSECQFHTLHWDKAMFREIVGFTGWTLFGQISTVGRNQAVTILLNQSFNPVVVAARAIAVTVATQINVFANNFNLGLYPALIKSYAEKNSAEMYSLVFGGSRATFFLMWLPALPIYLEMDLVLQLWLKNPPADAVVFTRLALLEALVMSISLPIATAARAPGKMKFYELSLGTIQLGIFFVSWLVLVMGGAAYSVFVIAILANLIMLFTRLLIVKRLVGLPVKRYLLEVLIPISGVALLSACLAYALHAWLPKGLVFALLTMCFSVLVSGAGMYFLGITANERSRLNGMVRRRLAAKGGNA